MIRVQTDYLVIVFKKDGTILHQKLLQEKKFNVTNLILSKWFYTNLYDKIMSSEDYDDIDIVMFVNPADIYSVGFIFDTKLETPKSLSNKPLRFNKRRRSGFVMLKSVGDMVPHKYQKIFFELLETLGY